MQEETAGEVDGATHFVFEHKLFSVEGCYFAADRKGDKPKFLLPMGEEMAAIALGSLRQEFGIAEDSSDGQLLDIVAKSLKHVHEIRPKDSIPQELLDGSASWSVEERHRHAAHARVKIQLATLMTGREDQVIDPDMIEMLADDPKIKKQVQEAFSLVAKKLGLEPDQKQEVINKIEQLGHELSFIEGLRERFECITTIPPKLDRLSKFYGNQTSTWEELDRVKILLRGAIEDIETVFDIVDAQTCEIMTVLRSFDLHVKHIRDARDDLHLRFMDWDDIIEPWQSEEGRERSDEVEQLIKQSYRLLAQKFPQTQEWARANQS
jgi:predicted DNA-binding protein (MmcQ/YjbR family)